MGEKDKGNVGCDKGARAGCPVAKRWTLCGLCECGPTARHHSDSLVGPCLSWLALIPTVGSRRVATVAGVS